MVLLLLLLELFLSSSTLADRSWNSCGEPQGVTEVNWSHCRRDPGRGQLPWGQKFLAFVKQQPLCFPPCAPSLPSLLCLDLTVGRADASRVTTGFARPAATDFWNGVRSKLKHPFQLFLRAERESSKTKQLGVIYILSHHSFIFIIKAKIYWAPSQFWALWVYWFNCYHYPIKFISSLLSSFL